VRDRRDRRVEKEHPPALLVLSILTIAIIIAVIVGSSNH
jgi:hypothetical protein